MKKCGRKVQTSRRKGCENKLRGSGNAPAGSELRSRVKNKRLEGQKNKVAGCKESDQRVKKIRSQPEKVQKRVNLIR